MELASLLDVWAPLSHVTPEGSPIERLPLRHGELESVPVIHDYGLWFLRSAADKELTKLPWVRALRFNMGYKSLSTKQVFWAKRQEPGRPPACVFHSWAFTSACCLVLWLTGPLSLLRSLKNCIAACLTIVAAGHNSTITWSLPPALPWPPASQVHPRSHRSSAPVSSSPDSVFSIVFPRHHSHYWQDWELQSFIM